MIISIEIKRQTNKENTHHNRCGFNLLLIQQKNLRNSNKRKEKPGFFSLGEIPTKKEKRKLMREIEKEPTSPTENVLNSFFALSDLRV
jgi:hypothetical protein